MKAVSRHRMTSVIRIRLDRLMREGLARLAREDRRPVSAYCRKVLEDHLNQMRPHEIYDW